MRDALLGHQHLDWDLATAARPQQVRSLFPRTVPGGIEFGTVGVLDVNDVMHEVTTFRRDVHTDGRHAVVDFGVSLDEDLARRDLTINAIAFSPSTGEIRDPFAGRADLADGIVRAVGEPGERLREDRLRGLRAIRFAARFGFSLDAPTWDAIVASAPHLTRLSAERVKQEIEKTVEQVRYPGRAFRLWRECGALKVLIPAISGMTDMHLAALDNTALPRTGSGSGRKILRLTVLFSAAPASAVTDGLRALRFSNADAAWIGSIVSRWSALAAEMRSTLVASNHPADAVLRRWAAIAGRTRLASVLRLANSHWRAERDAGLAAPAAACIGSVYRRAVRIAYRDPIEIADLAVNGRDLERIGISGPAAGQTLRYLLETVINDPASNAPAILLDAARKQLSHGREKTEDGEPQR